MSSVWAVGRGVVFALIAVAVLALLLVLTGHAPGPALSALASGAFGSEYAWASTVVRAVPLAFAGLAVSVAFRAGLLNIGAEGQLLIGACVATATGPPSVRAPSQPGLTDCVAASGWSWQMSMLMLKVSRSPDRLMWRSATRWRGSPPLRPI